MLTAVLVDDEQPALDVLKILLTCNGHVTVLGAFSKAADALKSIGELKPDVIFVDIEMPGMTGLEMAASILAQGIESKVVFTTAFGQYALEAFEVDAVDYLVKPILQKKLDKVIAKLLRQKSKLNPQATVASNGGKVLCLGEFKVISPTGMPIKWRTAKVEELFAYLYTHRNTAVTKGRIIQALWLDCELVNVEKYLHTLVYNLKKTMREEQLPITLSFSKGAYTLSVPKSMFSDVEEVDKYAWKNEIQAVDVNIYEYLLSLHRGEYFATKDYKWCIAERQRLLHSFSQAALALLRYYIDCREYNKAEERIAQCLELLPFHEKFHEIRMLLYSLKGDRAAAVQHFRQVKQMFWSELGLPVSQNLQNKYKELLEAR